MLSLCNGTAEYSLLQGGNPGAGSSALKAEKSKQWTLGFRVEPAKSLSIGFDLWQVSLTDQITTLSQSEVFGNPAKYLDLFSAYYDPIQKQNVLAASLTPFNLAKAEYQGIDWDHTYKTNTEYGNVSVNWTGTYMLKADLDADGKGKSVEKTVGVFDSYNNVTFRVISKLTAAWKPYNRYTHCNDWLPFKL